MNNIDRKYVLPSKLEKLLAALSAYYGQQDQQLLQRVVVNSTYNLILETNYDNWNGGTWGHTLVLQIPQSIFYEIINEISDISEQLGTDINKLVTVDNEWICSVKLEIQDGPTLENWRKHTGLLLEESPLITDPTEDDLDRLWSSDKLRVFLSHKSEFKTETAQLKEQLEFYGISCFVAHDDIEPTKAWQDEIERALFSMDLLVALLTEDFQKSNWTDQEIGVAIGRGIPVISVRLGSDPYGFIGKYQGISGRDKSSRALAHEILTLTLSQPLTNHKAQAALVHAFCNVDSYTRANDLIKILEKMLSSVSHDLINVLENAPKSNSQISRAWTVSNKLPGLIKRLRSEGQLV